MTDNNASAHERLRNWVASEKIGGLLLIIAALVAMIWANSPIREVYHSIAHFEIGPDSIGLRMSVAHWAADGLLAIFFFVVGLELKHEIMAGSLRSPRRAAVPVVAAVGGMAIPAIIYSSVVVGLGEPSALHGWAIPTATDIAFALAVLAIFGRGLPGALRMFLLTLAVVDDLLAIVIIAVFYSSDLHLSMLALSLGMVVIFALFAYGRKPYWWILLPIAISAWAMMFNSGVHATIAGVLLGFAVPAKPVYGEPTTRTHHFEHLIRPISAGIALPLFAFFSAGVTLVDGEGISKMLLQPVVLAISAGLVIGKLIGVLGSTFLVTKFSPLRLPDGIGIRDLIPIGLLCGIGFTVSLLIAELSFPDETHIGGAKVAILIGTFLAAFLAAGTLRWNAKKARSIDMNLDGIPDRVDHEYSEDWIPDDYDSRERRAHRENGRSKTNVEEESSTQ